jgi:UrcA family protein
MNLSTRNPTAPPVRSTVLALLAASVIGALGFSSASAATTNSAAAAASASTADALSVTVRYGDLDLATAAGTRALYRRLVVAARQVCPASGSRELTILRFEEICRNQAIVNAARQIPSPQLAAMVASSIKAS